MLGTLAQLNACWRAFVFDPDGRQLTEPTDSKFDGLIYYDIDLDTFDYAKTLTD